MTEYWLFKNKDSDRYHSVNKEPIPKDLDHLMEATHVVLKEDYEKLEAENKELKFEISVLRQWGDKVCTSITDKELEKHRLTTASLKGD